MVRFDEPLSFADSVPEPDVAVESGSDSDFASIHPDTAELVMEITVTSPVEDRAMAPIYAEAGVKEYWIVLAAKQQVEVYRLLQAGQYRESRTYGRDEEPTCTSLPVVRLQVAEIFGI